MATQLDDDPGSSHGPAGYAATLPPTEKPRRPPRAGKTHCGSTSRMLLTARCAPSISFSAAPRRSPSTKSKQIRTGTLMAAGSADHPPDPGVARNLDELVTALRSLKVWAGDPSYDTITRRVNARWTAAGRPAGELARRGT